MSTRIPEKNPFSLLGRRMSKANIIKNKINTLSFWIYESLYLIKESFSELGAEAYSLR